jgi:HEAT repeat protein
MGIVDRLKTSKHLRTLKTSGASAASLAEAKAALVATGPSALSSLFELLTHREARAPVLELLEKLLKNSTLNRYVEALASPERAVREGVVAVLKSCRTYDAMDLLPFLLQPEVPKTILEDILKDRVEGLSARHLLAALPDFPRETRQLVFRLLEERKDSSAGNEVRHLAVHDDWWIRLHMAKLLTHYPGEETEDVLMRLLQDDNKTVRLATVKSLHALRSKKATRSSRSGTRARCRTSSTC